MKIIRKISVKQVLTEESKKNISHKLQMEGAQLKKECEQLLFELKKAERSAKSQTNALRTSFQKEIERREAKLKTIEFQLEQLEIVPLGTEIKESEVEAVLEINEGDHWDEVVKEIIVENGIVKEIRKG
ncbi:MAG TPA: YlqD family protein [Bacillus sp. (in: firmicutes)]|uniref:YlqD family protein n=1 Tax=Bacillus litorisediminis TaxID=2922713 RepID=UPI001FABC065|nr:YlqD family protein [Bacillus litorisediminis]HWO77931.1 YlqD family protein [Bacillus sp. (in: firmicutes)]